MKLDEIHAAAIEAYHTWSCGRIDMPCICIRMDGTKIGMAISCLEKDGFLDGFLAGTVDTLREHAIIHTDERTEPAHNQLTLPLEFEDETKLVC